MDQIKSVGGSKIGKHLNQEQVCSISPPHNLSILNIYLVLMKPLQQFSLGTSMGTITPFILGTLKGRLKF